MSVQIEAYADQALGMWSSGFDAADKERLNKLKMDLDAVITPNERAMMDADQAKFLAEMATKRGSGQPPIVMDNVPGVDWVIDEAERRGVCSAEEAAYLRSIFIHENGLPIVLNL